jgi:hypothetical protein
MHRRLMSQPAATAVRTRCAINMKNLATNVPCCCILMLASHQEYVAAQGETGSDKISDALSEFEDGEGKFLDLLEAEPLEDVLRPENVSWLPLEKRIGRRPSVRFLRFKKEKDSTCAEFQFVNPSSSPIWYEGWLPGGLPVLSTQWQTKRSWSKASGPYCRSRVEPYLLDGESGLTFSVPFNEMPALGDPMQRTLGQLQRPFRIGVTYFDGGKEQVAWSVGVETQTR